MDRKPTIASRHWWQRHGEQVRWGLTVAAATLLVVMGVYIDQHQDNAILSQQETLQEQNQEQNQQAVEALSPNQIPEPEGGSLSPENQDKEAEPQDSDQDGAGQQSSPGQNGAGQQQTAGEQMADNQEGFAFRWPLLSHNIQRGWGYDYNVNTEDYRFHRGVDMESATGTPVYAAAAGEVEQAYEDTYWGGVVIITHNNGWRSVYRCISPQVSPGQQVKAQETIGHILEEAPAEAAQKPHLHFEIEFEGESRNPEEEIK